MRSENSHQLVRRLLATACALVLAGCASGRLELPPAPEGGSGFRAGLGAIAAQHQMANAPAASWSATLGSPGGSQIINYVAKTIVGVLYWNLDIQQAISLPNFGSRNRPTELEEGRVSRDLVEALRARGHEVRTMELTSGVQGIVRGTRVDGAAVWIGRCGSTARGRGGGRLSGC